MILILTRSDDEHATLVCEHLTLADAPFRRLDPAEFPSNVKATIAFGSGGFQGGRIEVPGDTLPLDDISVIWRRRPGMPEAAPAISDPAVRAYVVAESAAFVDDLWETMDCPFLPARGAVIRRAGRKAMQLRLAAELGFELPPTRFTNDPAEFLAFYREHNGEVVTKAVDDGDLQAGGEYFGRYTEVVSKRDLGYVSAIRHCPIIAQAYVPKRIELRVTVVGRHVFAAEIHSQASNHTRHDWRRYDYGRTPYAVHSLPPEIEDQCIHLVARLGLAFGAIDLIVTPAGRYVFLEINPNGQFAWIEHETGLPIAQALAAQLIAMASTNRALAGTGISS